VNRAQPGHQAEHTAATKAAYERLAPVWSATTDDGPFNGRLERPALRSLVPGPLDGRVVLDAGCGSGAQCEWLQGQGAQVIGVDLSPAMVEETRQRCGERGRFFVADLAQPLDVPTESLDGVTCSLMLHYLRDWTVPLASFARSLRPGGWAVISLDHPFASPLPSQCGGYFDTELVSDTWRKGDVEVEQFFWRRPLGAVVDAFAAAGFVIDAIREARPTADAVAAFPDDLEHTLTEPSFIVYRLRRP
jgi:SAM-dependent methyltransferase